MIYLNNAATTYPKPTAVLRTVAAQLALPPDEGGRSNSGDGGVIEACRMALGELFHAPPERIFFTSSATESFNLIVQGLPLRRVVVTEIEHNALLRPLCALLPDAAITVVSSDEQGRIDMRALAKAVTPDIDALFLNHCSNVTGSIQNLAVAGEIARQNGALFVVDAAQSAGVAPIDVEHDGIDILVFTGHKGLFGPSGTGGFYLRAGVPLAPVKFGGTGTEGGNLRPVGAELFEVGTLNHLGIAGLLAGVRFVLDSGVEVIRRRVDRLARQLANGLHCLPGVAVYGGENAPRGGAIGFTVEGLSPADVGYILRHSYNIIVRTGFQCAPLFMAGANLASGLTRASVSYLTQESDIDALLHAMREIAGG